MGAKRQAKKEFEKEQELAKLRAAAAKTAAAQAQLQARKRQAAAERAAAHKAKLESMTPEQRAAYIKRNQWTFYAVAASLVVLIGGCVTIAIVNSDEDSSSSNSSAGGIDSDATANLRTYLSENFSGTSWYSSITGVEVIDDVAVVHTSLSGEGKRATSVCQGVSGWVFSNASTLTALRVLSSSNQLLVARQSVSDSC